jgi:hypothetical protein
MLGLDRFPLWCCTVPDSWFLIESRPVDVWELNVADSQIVGFIRESVWDAILKGRGDEWASVIVAERPIQPDKNITALVLLPLELNCVKCHGKLVRREWREEAQFLKTRDRGLQWRYVKMHREAAADQNNHPIARTMAADRADYLEEALGLKPQPEPEGLSHA